MTTVDLKLPGVSFYARNGRWLSRISVPEGRKHLGYFDTQEEAHAAYVEAKAGRATPEPKAKALPHRKPPANEPLGMPVLEALFSSTFISMYGAQDERGVEVMLLVITASRLEGVFPFIASEAYLAPDMVAFEDLTVDVLRQRIQLLRKRGLLDRVSEVVDRALRGGDLVSFEQAVAEVSAGDLC